MNIVKFSGVQGTESGCHIRTVWTFRTGCAEVFRLNVTVQVAISVGDGVFFMFNVVTLMSFFPILCLNSNLSTGLLF